MKTHHTLIITLVAALGGFVAVRAIKSTIKQSGQLSNEQNND
ncbi:hypothetical protein [Algicola sagamiensis]|nr:hypothetical protein [Algicola sagamiensis]